MTYDITKHPRFDEWLDKSEAIHIDEAIDRFDEHFKDKPDYEVYFDKYPKSIKETDPETFEGIVRGELTFTGFTLIPGRDDWYYPDYLNLVDDFEEWLDNQEHEEEPSEPDHEKHYKLKIEEGR